MNIKRLTLDSIALAILIISAYISIPVTEITYTLQVLVVLLLAFLLPVSDGIIISVIYILIGLIGLPVFSSFKGGLSYIFNPSFGFLIGFIFVPIVKGLIYILPINKELTKQVLTSIISILIIYLIACIYFYLIQKYYFGNSINYIYVITIVVMPYILVDILKITAAILIANKLKPIIKQKGLLWKS